MDGHPIRLSQFGRIFAIRPNPVLAGFHILRCIGYFQFHVFLSQVFLVNWVGRLYSQYQLDICIAGVSSALASTDHGTTTALSACEALLPLTWMANWLFNWTTCRQFRGQRLYNLIGFRREINPSHGQSLLYYETQTTEPSLPHNSIAFRFCSVYVLTKGKN